MLSWIYYSDLGIGSGLRNKLLVSLAKKDMDAVKGYITVAYILLTIISVSLYKGKALGMIGDFGCYSFHETKNYSRGEGGAIVINNERYIEKAEILREKGENRAQFFRGQVAKYNWGDFGDSYLPSDLNAAYFWAQLEMTDEINSNRIVTWHTYYDALKPLEDAGKLSFQQF